MEASNVIKDNFLAIGLIAILLFFIFLFSSCEHQPIVEDAITLNNPDPFDSSSYNHPCDADTIYFYNDILPLFISNCAKSGCHDAGSHEEGIILDSYTNIINIGDIRAFDPNHGKILDKIADSDPDDIMPPPPAKPLDQDQINLITSWINQGALDNGCDACDTLGVTYSGKIKPIVQSHCVGCHSGYSSGGGFDLTTHSGVEAIALNGKFLGSVNHNPGYSAMPKGGNKLLNCEIDMIANWINDGTPNN